MTTFKYIFSFLVVITLFCSCEEERFKDISGEIIDVQTGKPVDDAQIRVFTSCGSGGWIKLCSGGGSARSNVMGQFVVSLYTGCDPSIEVTCEYPGHDAYIYEDNNQNIIKLIGKCGDPNTAKLMGSDNFHLRISRYPGVDININKTSDSTKVKMKEVEVLGLVKKVDELTREGVYAVPDTVANLIFLKEYEDGTKEKDSLDYHYIDNSNISIDYFK